MDLQKEIKEIEQEALRLARKREALLQKELQVQNEGHKLESLFKDSGYQTPKALVDALILKFRVQPTEYNPETGRRKHIRVHKNLRDTIKHDLSTGMTVAAVARRHEICYTVASRISKGLYDHLV
jgi:hypothetical protein